MSTSLQSLNENQSIQEWATRIKECRNSNMTVRGWCSEQGISTHTFYYWQKKIFNIVSAQRHETEFAEIPLVPSPVSLPSQDVLAKVRVNEFEVVVPSASNIEELAKLFAVLKKY
ncbi:MAG: hypothetical protein Q4D21_03150 [Phascolarctobacterium sp.]|nr:hypothetical protein [Phascolarctobacterium sp.]